MPAGIQINSSRGSTQIDGNYRNMNLISTEDGSLFLHTIDNVRAFRPTLDGTFSIRCYCMDNINCYYELTRNVRCYNFGWELPAAQKYGLEVFNEAGVLVFSSTAKPLRVLEFVTLNVANLSGSTVFSKSYPGRTIAIVASQIPYNFERNGQNIRGYSTIFTINGDTLSVVYGVAKEWYAYRGSITTSANRNDVFQPYANFLVVDVTGY